ncbi:MAG: zinc-ribbon and DUF3426 domain-containing protein [Pseudomonadota bacterium]|nr:zinc-ribbon and DUF3426 domain-containing protein [Pseudomonadota bacterium]
MLITTCAHCRSRFRVTPQQLNAKQGQVRCGSCEKVFNGFEALERFPDDDTGGRLLAARESEERAGDVDFDVLAPEPMPEIETIDPKIPAVPIEEPVRVSPAAPARAAAPIVELTLDTPPPAPISRAWSFGAVLLAVALALELAYAFRGPIAQRYPVLRPALESACARLQCNVPWAREEGMLKLEDSELLEVPGKPTEIALGARIRNLASVAQEYPHLELTLTDLTGQAALRRVLRPTDYLGRPVAQGEVLPAGVEIALQLRLETPRIKATGYELLLFYP